MDTLDSVSNALRIIGLLRIRGSVAVTEVSRELGVAKSTAHRLLTTLVAENFAERDPVERRYFPGPAILMAGMAAVGDFDLRRRAWGPMRELAARTNVTVKTVMLQGPFVRCLDLVSPGGEVGNAYQSDQMMPANACAGGKLLLTHDTEEELRARFPKGLPAMTEHTITDWNTFLVERQTIRERGWASNNEESSIGTHAYAVPIPGLINDIAAALIVSGPEDRFVPSRRQELLHHMRLTVTLISSRNSLRRRGA